MMKIRENGYHCKMRAAKNCSYAKFIFFNLNETREKKACFV